MICKMSKFNNFMCMAGLAVMLFLISPMYNICQADEPTGWIVFESNRDGDTDIWAIRPDGSGLRKLTDQPFGAHWPQWSPDSTRIAYSSYLSGLEAQLWVYDWFAGTKTRIYDAHDYEGQDLGSYNVSCPAWSPDGSKILFREDASYNNPHITVINADGTGRAIVPVQSGYVSFPSWCPTGTAFVYDRRNSGLSYTHDLWIYDFTATGDIMNGINHRLTEGAGSESTTKFAADWTPSGDIVFAWGHNIAVIDPGESGNWGDPSNPNVTFLTSDAIFHSLMYGYPSWSPGMSQIVCGRGVPSQGDLWVMDASGDNPYPLIATAYQEESPDWGNPMPQPVLAEIDIKPGSCPNPVNVKSSGVLPVAILGTDDVNVITIDPTSIRLAGVEPLRSGYEDVATPVSDSNDCNCITDGPDGFLDLTLKFKTQRIVEAIGDVNDGDVLTLELTGVLFGERPIVGTDCILIRGRHKPINPADINKDGVVNTADFAIFAQNWLQSSIVDE